MADAIVSGLPWAAFAPEMQQRVLDEMMRVLRPGGRFVTFAYLQGLLLAGGQNFARVLPKYFSEVQRSRIIWNNLPPAFVYRCKR
jgi:phospholipid N-methyltransferase